MDELKEATTDNRFVRIGRALWWDTAGVELVGQDVIDAYLATHPQVGIVIYRRRQRGDPEI